MRDYGEWTRSAVCQLEGMDPSIFSRPRDDYETREAKRVCQLQCPVKHKCLAQAIIYQEVGIWGGYSEAERKYISPRTREKVMANAILEDNIDPELISDPKGIEMYNNLVKRLEVPRKLISNTDTYSGPMAA